MNKFEKVKNDEEIIRIYEKVSEVEDLNKGWAHHDYNHVCNVAGLVEKLLTELNYEKEFIEEAKIAAILHDIGCLEGKEGHPFRSFEFAKEYLRKNNLNLKYEDLVLEAIRIHSEGFDTDNIIALTLIMSDKLDIKYTRVAKEGYHIPGNRQFQYIKEILIDIHNHILEINFICDDKIDKLELEEFYFTKKVFKAIKAFSAKMGVIPEVLFNSEKWNEFYCFS